MTHANGITTNHSATHQRELVIAAKNGGSNTATNIIAVPLKYNQYCFIITLLL